MAPSLPCKLLVAVRPVAVWMALLRELVGLGLPAPQLTPPSLNSMLNSAPRIHLVTAVSLLVVVVVARQAPHPWQQA